MTRESTDLIDSAWEEYKQAIAPAVREYNRSIESYVEKFEQAKQKPWEDFLTKKAAILAREAEEARKR